MFITLAEPIIPEQGPVIIPPEEYVNTAVILKGQCALRHHQRRRESVVIIAKIMFITLAVFIIQEQ